MHHARRSGNGTPYVESFVFVWQKLKVAEVAEQIGKAEKRQEQIGK
jgi:hypothetical protein